MRCPKCITVNIPESPVTRLAGGASCMDTIHSSSPCHAPADMCAAYNDNLHSEVPLSLLKATIMLTFFHIDAFLLFITLFFAHISPDFPIMLILLLGSSSNTAYMSAMHPPDSLAFCARSRQAG